MEKTYLMKRNGNLYFRKKVPQALQRKVHLQEIRYSLRGLDAESAKAKCIVLNERLSYLFVKALKGWQDKRTLYSLIKKTCEDVLFGSGDAYQVANMLKPATIPKTMDSISKKLTSSNFDCNCPIMKDLYCVIMKIHQNITQLHTNNHLAPSHGQLSAFNSPPELPYKKLPLGKLLKEYINEKKACNKWDKRTEITYRSQFEILIEYFGKNTDISEIKRIQITDLIENVLKKYPCNRRKFYPTASLSVVLKMKTRTINSKTQSNYLMNWKAFFSWCVLCGHISVNPAERFSIKQEIRKDELRLRFTDKDLELIFRKIQAMPFQKGFDAINLRNIK